MTLPLHCVGLMLVIHKNWLYSDSQLILFYKRFAVIFMTELVNLELLSCFLVGPSFSSDPSHFAFYGLFRVR